MIVDGNENVMNGEKNGHCNRKKWKNYSMPYRKKEMKVSFILTTGLLFLFLAACSDTSMTYSDPVQAQAVVDMATAYAKETAKVERQLAAESTRQAAATRQASEYEMALIDKQIQGTQIALDVQATQDARAFATQEAITNATAQAIGTATAIARTATPDAATQVAISNQTRLENDRQTARVITMWAWALVPPAMVVVAFVFLLLGGKEAFEWWIKWHSLKERLHEKREGLVIYNFNPQLKDFVAELLAPRRELAAGYIAPARSQRQPEVINLTPSGSVVSAPLHNRQVSARLAIELLYDAIDAVGEDATAFPGWRDLPGWSSWKWQKGFGYWEIMKVAQALPGSGSPITHPDFHTIGELAYALETKKIQLCPFPKDDKKDAKSKR